MALTDKSRMPYGQYAGAFMEDVPASYLLWLWNEKKCTEEVSDYIQRNMSALEKEDPDTIVLRRPK